ncbi:hypothetical protein N7495_004180 [Penicillium taxi]|uniref:uncharacterized protein n=1 Tax=Penicillium taxi TaxID=168475 RepID=UPI002545619E|nr:uncharacterized protein N7495_004180 [Penicillium taxi]KAJ5899436.1 hypothetical protein N7495_004180 [Penicillium taxi]
MAELGPLCSPRERTVTELARMLDEDRVIHVRGTPASGKSTLANLLARNYRQKKIPVIAFNCWRDTWDYRQKITEQASLRGYEQFDDYEFVNHGDYVLIFDEGQMTYGDDALWIGLIKNQSGSRYHGPRICLFSSYGSATEGPDIDVLDSVYRRASPLAYLGAQQRVSITPSSIKFSPKIALFYNLEEFEEIVGLFCSQKSGFPQLRLDETAREYIYDISNGHPGAEYHSDLKHQDLVIDDTMVINSLDDEGKAFNHIKPLPISRSFPVANIQKVSSEAADILRKALSEGNVERDLNNPGLRQCYEKGWLHSEPLDCDAGDTVCVFPTRLHANGIGHFGNAAIIRLYEATYQDEFYRAAHQVLGYSMNVTSEWSSKGKSRIDFRFAQVAWGVELLREGDQIQEHCQRFYPGGTYAPWIAEGSIKDWLVIDCRTTRPNPNGENRNSP